MYNFGHNRLKSFLTSSVVLVGLFSFIQGLHAKTHYISPPSTDLEFQNNMKSIVASSWTPLKNRNNNSVIKNSGELGWNWNRQNDWYQDHWNQQQNSASLFSQSPKASQYIDPYEIHYYYPDSQPFKRWRETEAADRIGSKILDTLVGTSLVKLFGIIVVIKLFIGLFILTSFSAAGFKLAPVVLPLLLLPIGIAAFLAFIPIFLIALVVLGLAGEQEDFLDLKKRKRRRKYEPNSLQTTIEEIFSHLPELLKDPQTKSTKKRPNNVKNYNK